MIEGQSSRLRPLEWIGGSKKDLMALPDEVVLVALAHALPRAHMR